jgi:hypothetical protein
MRWGQLKRHRSATLIKSSHIDSGGPLVIPPSIQISGRQDRWQELASQVFAFRDKLAGPLRPYLRINAEAVKVYARLNLRSYIISAVSAPMNMPSGRSGSFLTSW